GMYDVAGRDQTLATLDTPRNGSSRASVITNSGNDLKTLTVASGAYAGMITGKLNLKVTGALDLLGSSTYQGDTLVTGQLRLKAVGTGTDFLPKQTILTVTKPGSVGLYQVNQTVAGLKGDGTIFNRSFAPCTLTI